MNYRILSSLLCFILFCASCQKRTENEVRKDVGVLVESTKNEMNFKSPQGLNSAAQDLVKDWEEYKRVDEFLKNDQNQSNQVALFNAKELSNLTGHLRDSIRIPTFEIPALKIRLNVLHNEALRLQDMSNISVITPDAVSEERQKIYDAFSAINSKLNNMTDQELINERLTNFVDEMALDTTRNLNSSNPALDSISN